MRLGSLDVVSARKRCGVKRSAIPLVASALCVLFIAVSLLSVAFVLAHANHDHDHDGPFGTCATCARMAAVENLLKRISTAVAAIVIAVGGLFAALFVLKPVFSGMDPPTPVNLKVRLNS